MILKIKNFLFLGAISVYNFCAAQIIPKNELGESLQYGYANLSLVEDLIAYWIQWILSLSGGFAVIMVMYGGYQYMIGGTTDSKDGGKRTIIYALAGLFVAFFAWWIVELVQVWMTT